MVEGGFTGYSLAARVKFKLEEDLQRVFRNVTLTKIGGFFPIKCFQINLAFTCSVQEFAGMTRYQPYK